ncbi:MAG: helix-turn-helix transcriptional regulator [Ilumatobacteraceae bacterium]|jgi:predicted DNA-binding transcriptional regulator YafY
MVDALTRATNVLTLLLESRRPLTFEQIADSLAGQYEGSEQTQRAAFERDKETLRSVGVPIDTEVLGGTDAGRTGYSVDRRRYELADLDLTDDERRALQSAVAAVHVSEGDVGILKLGGGASEHATVVANVPDVPGLAVLREASAARAEVTFTYRDKERRFHPYSLMLRDGYWYAIGHEVTVDEQRTYRVDRIEGDVQRGDDGMFVRPEGFDPRSAFPSDAMLIGGQEVVVARVRVDAARAAKAVIQLGPDAVEEKSADGSVIVAVRCANVDAFRSWVFGMGLHAEVLSPPSIRDAVVGWLREMVAVGGAR